MAVFRVERIKDYTVMSNHHLRNKNLSLKAKGLLSQMLSLPDNWEEVLALWQAGKITAREAMRRTGMKRTTFYQLVRKSS